MVSTRGSVATPTPELLKRTRSTRNSIAPPTPQSLDEEVSTPSPARIRARMADAPIPPHKLFRVVNGLRVYDDSTVYLCLPRRLDKTLDSKSQLLVVKMNTRSEPDPLRRESNILARLEEVEGSERFIGSSLLREQFTSFADLSFLCLRPIFGRNLREFADQFFRTEQRMPAYFLSHVFLGLVDAFEFIHGTGIAHNNVSISNVMLNPYPPNDCHQFNAYPDVVLIDFAQAGDLTEESRSQDVKGLLTVVRDVAQPSPSLVRKAGATAAKDNLLKFSGELQEMLARNRKPTLESVKNKWAKMALKQRKKGPSELPPYMTDALHSDLTSADELDRACKTILKLKEKRQNFANLVRGDDPMEVDG